MNFFDRHAPHYVGDLVFENTANATIIAEYAAEDRFARSLTDLFQLLDELSRKNVAFQCVHQSIDTSSSTGKLTLAILGAVAEFENDIRRERQRAGIAKAKANGVYRGRRASIDSARVKEFVAQGMTASAIASELGCHRQSVYRHMAACCIPNQ